MGPFRGRARQTAGLPRVPPAFIARHMASASLTEPTDPSWFVVENSEGAMESEDAIRVFVLGAGYSD